MMLMVRFVICHFFCEMLITPWAYNLLIPLGQLKGTEQPAKACFYLLGWFPNTVTILPSAKEFHVMQAVLLLGLCNRSCTSSRIMQSITSVADKTRVSHILVCRLLCQR
jgi:hypothetical protein